jgi:hypothetical protein
MLFMVIERFKTQDPILVYNRVRDPGITFPDGLKYVGSWIEPNFDRCFQLMQGDAGSRRAVPGRQIETAPIAFERSGYRFA